MTDAQVATSAAMNEIAATLAAAFDDDPMVTYLLPVGLRGRDGRLRNFMRAPASLALRNGSLWTTPDRKAAAAWQPPNRWKPGPADMLRLAPRTTWAMRTRALLGMRVMQVLEDAHPTEPHWYLEVLGTHPDRQGKGLGRAVVEPVLEMCDRDGLPAYLESSKESNIPYYERFGFKVTGTLDMPDGGPRLWPMWREPA